MTQLRGLLAVLMALTIVASACGSDGGDDEAADDTATEDTQEAEETETTDETADDSADETTDTDADESAGADTSVSGEMITQPGECGLNNGEEATGEPILVGAGATNIPGVDFTWGPKMSQLYFDCVNANGGIHGRPIQFSWEEGAPDPAAWQAIATKLVEEDQVHVIAGTFSLVECDVNGDYYEENGYSPMIAGVAPGCYLDDTFSALNMGPYYSNLGAAQAVVRAGAENKLVVASPDQPGMDFNNSSVEDMANIAGLDYEGLLIPVPIADPAAVAQQLINAAGTGGGVVLNFTGPTVLPLLQAISEQGLVDEVIWGSSTPPNDPTVAQALADCCGTDWDGKFLINAEFDLLDSGKPDAELMLELYGAEDRDFPVSAFTQMGFLIAKATVEALLRMGEGADITVESADAAVRSLTNLESDMLCKPWYFSHNLGTGNVSNNTDRTVVPEGGNMVLFEDCFEIQETENNPLAAIREAEAAAG